MTFQDSYLRTLQEMQTEESDALRSSALKWVLGEYEVYQGLIDDVHRFLEREA